MESWDVDYLKKEYDKVAAEYAAVCDSNRFIKSIARCLPNGLGLRLVARIPVAASTIHPEVKKYLSTDCNGVDSRKEIDALLKRFPEFDLRGK